MSRSINTTGTPKVTAAVATAMLGGTLDQVTNAVSLAWIDGGALRTYRHAPNTGSRKSWAAGDATARAVAKAFDSLLKDAAVGLGAAEEKVQMQQYITGCYGSLTTFNVLFANKGDQFVGQKGDD